MANFTPVTRTLAAPLCEIYRRELLCPLIERRGYLKPDTGSVTGSVPAAGQAESQELPPLRFARARSRRAAPLTFRGSAAAPRRLLPGQRAQCLAPTQFTCS